MDATDLLISSGELSARLQEQQLRLFDCRWSLADPTLGLRQFQKGHIPNSQYMPLEPDLCDPAGSRGRHPLPTRERFAQILGSYGVTDQSTIVAYDDGSSMTACRLWWMARWLGHTDVRVLDGGLYQWESQGLNTTIESVQYEPAEFLAGESLTRYCSADQLPDSAATLLDARSQERFDGQSEPIDHTAGHIPGAVCFPHEENLNADKTFIQNSSRFNSITKDQDVICYCGSGVSATNNILALLLSGFPEPALYAGSWSEWIENPNRPVSRNVTHK